MTPGLRLYLFGQLQSVVCSWAQVVAISVVAIRLDPSLLGWVITAQFLPSLLLGPWFGVLADRHDRRLLLIIAETGLGLVAVGYATVSLLARLDAATLLALASAWGVLNALDTPARRSMVPSLMPDAPTRTSATSTVVLLVGMTTGSALGGWLMGTSGPEAVFALNSVSFAVDVVVLHLLRRHVRRTAHLPRARGQVREGLEYVLGASWLRVPLVSFAVIGTFAISFQVSVPLLVTDTFAGGVAAVGTALSSLALGSLVGAVWMFTRDEGRALIRPAAVVLTAGFVAAAAAPTYTFALAALAVIGAAWSVYLTGTLALLQQADQQYLGRVMSLFAVLLIGSTTVGGPLASGLAVSLGARAPFVLGVVATAVGLAVLGRRSPGVRPTALGAAPG